MSDDLVQRLRDEALNLHGSAWRNPSGGQDTTISAMLAEEAADHIEALATARAEAAEAAIADAHAKGVAEGLRMATDVRPLWLHFTSEGELDSVCSEPLDDHEPYIRRSAIRALIPALAKPADGWLPVCDCGLSGPCMWSECKHPLSAPREGGEG